jgi:hypothetical protein
VAGSPSRTLGYFGALNLAVAVLALWAAWKGAQSLVLITAVVFTVYQAPHLLYHLRHLDVYDTSDKVANVVSLSLGVALPALVILRHLTGAAAREERPVG